MHTYVDVGSGRVGRDASSDLEELLVGFWNFEERAHACKGEIGEFYF